MNAKDLFPDEKERRQVKEWLDMFKGKLVRVWDKDGVLVYENKLHISVDNCNNVD